MMRGIVKWLKNDDANAAIEAGFLFPVLVTILLGIVDMGVGLIVNEKVINSAHMMADLLAREDDISDAELTEAAVAAEMVIQPYETITMGYDVAGIQFLGAEMVPTERWRDTFNMDPNPDVLVDSIGLGYENEGVLAVTVRYTYTPYFSNFVVGQIEMQEVSYARGRKGNFVTRSEAGS